MKRLSICFLLSICGIYSGFCQVPEIINSDLTVSEGYSTYAVMDSIYYFQAHDGDYDWELWRSDGTEAGTYRVTNVNPGGPSYANQLTRVGDQLYFMGSYNDSTEQLFLTDGTEEGTHWLYDVDPEGKELYHMLTASGGILYFRTYRPNIYTELWVTDGVTGHTHMVDDICVNIPGNPDELTDLNGSLVFAATNCVHSGNTLYRTDGLYGSIGLLGGDHVWGLTRIDDQIYFVSTFEGYGGELSVSDGLTPGIGRLTDINPGDYSAEIYHLTKLDSLILFRATEPDHGAELWSYNPQTGNARLVKDINPGPNNSSFPDQLIAFKGKLFFNANDGVHGNELWVSDGTQEGTYMLKNIWEETGDYLSHGYPQDFFATEDLLFFIANDGIHGVELWQTDGTSDGTKMTADIWPRYDESSYPQFFAVAGDYLIFNAWYSKRTLFRLNLHPGSTVGVVPESELPLFHMYPNPAHSSIIIEPVSGAGFRYTILDISGREMMSGLIPQGDRTRLDLSTLTPGLYFMKAETGSVQKIEKFTIY